MLPNTQNPPNHVVLSNKGQQYKLKESPWNYFQVSVSPSHALLHVRSGIHLYSFEQIPAFQKDNVYITHGYRSYLSARQCCKSMFILSNELVNIWTHGGMGIFLLVLLFYDQLYLLPSMRASISDHFIFLTFDLSSQVCMACSTGYHTFNCHLHEKVALRWYSFDLFGITLSMLGCYCIGLYYGFYCVKGIGIFYTILVFSMMIVSGVLMIHPKYLTESWRNYRLIHLSSFCISGLLPTIHWSLVVPAHEMKTFLPGVLTFYCILGLAMFIYITRIPERIWPGSFNLVGHSHNWWHVLVGTALLYWRYFAMEMLKYRLSSSCINAPL